MLVDDSGLYAWGSLSMMVKSEVCGKQETRQSLMQDDSKNTRKFWTKNRISILIPWITPLMVSLGIGCFNIIVGFIAFLILSVIARIVVVKTSSFAGMFREDFEQHLCEERIILKDGSVISTDDIHSAKKRIKLFGWISVSAWTLVPFLPTEELAFLGYAFWLILFQALSKSYLITRDLPLNGFPFFRSSNRIRNNLEDPEFFRNSNTDTYSSYGTTNATSPFHILNRNR
jgi:hypothetical protein